MLVAGFFIVIIIAIVIYVLYELYRLETWRKTLTEGDIVKVDNGVKTAWEGKVVWISHELGTSIIKGDTYRQVKIKHLWKAKN